MVLSCYNIYIPVYNYIYYIYHDLLCNFNFIAHFLISKLLSRFFFVYLRSAAHSVLALFLNFYLWHSSKINPPSPPRPTRGRFHCRRVRTKNCNEKKKKWRKRSTYAFAFFLQPFEPILKIKKLNVASFSFGII